MRKILMLAACLFLTGCLENRNRLIYVTYDNGEKDTIVYTSKSEPYLKQGCILASKDGITITLACGVRKIVFE